MSRALQGKVAIVTGSGQGVAKGIAVGLGRAGAKVVTNDLKPNSGDLSDWVDRDEIEALLNDDDRREILALCGDAETTADAIVEEGGEAIPFYGDISDFDTVGRMVDAAMEQWGRVDILVNSAAGLGFGPFMELSREGWMHQTNAKLNGTFNTMHHALPIMQAQGYGRIFNASSGAWIGVPSLAAYSAANAGVIGLTKAVAGEIWGTGVTCNAYCPSAMSRSHINFRAKMRKLLEYAGPEAEETRKKLEHVEQEHQSAENLAPFFVYLSTEEAGHISGSVFDVAAGGRISIYADHSMSAQISKSDSPWTLEELSAEFNKTILKDYVTADKRLG